MYNSGYYYDEFGVFTVVALEDKGGNILWSDYILLGHLDNYYYGYEGLMADQFDKFCAEVY